MASPLLPRLAFRQSRLVIQRRAQSTTSKAADAASSAAAKVKDGAHDVAGKAQEVAGQAQQGLSRVTSSAGNAAGSAVNAAGAAISSVGGRTGALISFVQGLVPPTVYYARVGGELAQIIFKGRNMYPPTMQTLQTYMTPLQNALRNPSTVLNRTASQANAAAQSAAETALNNPSSFLERLRNFDAATLTSVGIVTAEVIGFFTVGEMIGRFKMIGYRSSNLHSEH